MASKELVKYVKEHIELGFSADNIRLELLKHGHSAADVEEALGKAGAEARREGKKEGPRLITKIAVFVTVLLAVAIVIFFVFAKIKAPVEEAAPAPFPEEPELLPEREIPPEAEAPPVVAPTPEAPPEKEVPPEEEKKPEAVPAAPAPIVPTGREVPEYDISRLSFNLTERLEVIKGVSLQNPDAAVAMCADYNRIAERDICFAMIARSIPDFNLCGRIVETILRDQCYLSFAVTGTDTCNKINDTSVKEACDKLIQLNLTRRMP